MPDSINIGGISLRLTAFQERTREKRGESVRSFSNVLMNGTDLSVRTWDGMTDWETPETETALRAVVEAGNVVCSGLTLHEESVLCEVTVESVPRGPNVQGAVIDHSTLNVTMALVLKEVGP